MGTEDEQQLTLQGRATAAAGAAFVAAAIVNPLDVIKTRIQAQAMAPNAASGACTAANLKCSSTLYEHAARRALHHCSTELQHHQQSPLHRYSHLLRHSHTLSPAEAAAWLHASSTSSARTAGLAAATAFAAAADCGGAGAGAAAVFRRWGITEGPCNIPIRRTPAAPTNGFPASSTSSTAFPASSTVLPASSSSRYAGAAALNACECAAAHQELPAHSMWETAKVISSREGLPVLWRGTWASLLIAVPMVGIYMPLYDALLGEWSSKLGSAAPVAAGTAARTAACFCVAPFELLRTRLQAAAGSGVSARNTIKAFFVDHHVHQQQQQHVRSPGTQQQQQSVQQQRRLGPSTVLRAVPRLWTGFSATLVRDVPFSALYWALVEPFRQAMLPKNSHWNCLQQHRSSSSSTIAQQQQVVHHTQLEILVANMVSGFVAGGIAAGLTTPFDVVKTRMQISRPGASSSSSTGSSSSSRLQVWNILQDVYRKNGAEGLFTGVKPRAYRAAPACAIVISVYELLKHYLTPQ